MFWVITRRSPETSVSNHLTARKNPKEADDLEHVYSSKHYKFLHTAKIIRTLVQHRNRMTHICVVLFECLYYLSNVIPVGPEVSGTRYQPQHLPGCV